MTLYIQSDKWARFALVTGWLLPFLLGVTLDKMHVKSVLIVFILWMLCSGILPLLVQRLKMWAGMSVISFLIMSLLLFVFYPGMNLTGVSVIAVLLGMIPPFLLGCFTSSYRG